MNRILPCPICQEPTLVEPEFVACCEGCLPEYMRRRLEAACRGEPDPYDPDPSTSGRS